MPGLVRLLVLTMLLPVWLPVEAAPMKVVVGILPLADFVARLGASRLQVETLVPPGRPPELFEPSPQQLARLAQARLYVRVGLLFEDRVLADAATRYPNLTIHDLRQGLALLPMDAHDHDHAGHPVGASDPHVWLDPIRMKTAAEKLSAALVRLDPEGERDYRAGLAQLQKELDAIDAEIRERLSGLSNRRFYVFHPAFGYFADRYGLVQRAVETGGKEPGARQLAALIAQARADQATTLFVQPQFSPRSLTAIAKALDASVVILDDLPEDLLANYRDLADKLAAALASPPLTREAGGDAGERGNDARP
ncbi:zinc ABC transporter substrate-binding protein [bacterium]|nr:zinc ABC transporter substrate-binding protein [bacterium]